MSFKQKASKNFNREAKAVIDNNFKFWNKKRVQHLFFTSDLSFIIFRFQSFKLFSPDPRWHSSLKFLYTACCDSGI